MLILGGAFALQMPVFRGGGPALKRQPIFALLKEKNLILLILIILFGVGTQNGLFLWLVSFLKEARSFSIFLASVGLALFSAGVATGRLGSGWMAARWKNTRVILILLCLLNLDLFLLMFFSGKGLILILCFMAGLGCSGLFPCLLALGGICFPQWAGTAMGLLGTAAGIGSTLVSGWISFASQGVGVDTGFFINLLTALIALTLVAASYRRLKALEKT